MPVTFLLSQQNEDGSFSTSYPTYVTGLALDGLAASGSLVSGTAPAIAAGRPLPDFHSAGTPVGHRQSLESRMLFRRPTSPRPAVSRITTAAAGTPTPTLGGQTSRTPALRSLGCN